MTKIISNFNPNLEKDLLEFFKRPCDELFMDKIYNPLRYLASYILQSDNSPYLKNSIDRDGMIIDMVAKASQAIKTYKKNRDTTMVSYLRIVMKNYYLSERTKSLVKKRNRNLDVYIEDMGKLEDPQVEEDTHFDNMKENVSVMWTKEQIYKVFYTAEQRKAVKEIIKCINNPEKYDYHWNSYISSIGLKAKLSSQLIRYVIRKMSECHEKI